MATLLVGVNASETLWQISAPIAQDTIYLKVGTEIVSVLSDFTGGTLLPTGATVPSKVRVKRPIGGTTAASHLQGVTLTEYADASVFAGAAAGPDVYYSPTDPGAVGAGSIWLRYDDDANVYSVFVRSDDDVSWISPSLAVYGDGSSESYTALIQNDGLSVFVGLKDVAGERLSQMLFDGNEVSIKSFVDDVLEGQVIVSGGTLTLIATAATNLILRGLPTLDPVDLGTVWNDAGTMKISAGA